MSSVVHTRQSWHHVLPPRTPWHQPPVKHLIVPCVAQEHNHTCSSGSSKHGKPTSSPLHVLGFQRCKSLSQYRWKTSNYSNRHNFHEIRSIQETSCHPNPPFFLHFTILIKDMCIGFTRKKSSQGPHVFLIPFVPPPPAPRFRAPWVATSKRVGIDTRQQPESGCKAPKAWKVSKVHKPRDFLGKSVSKIISSTCVWYPKKNIYIYIYVAPTVLICVVSLGYFFWGGEYRLPKTNIAPFFVWVFGTSGGTWTACIWLFTTSKGHATSQPRRLRRCRIQHLLPGDD